jgi:hypothetical protein
MRVRRELPRLSAGLSTQGYRVRALAAPGVIQYGRCPIRALSDAVLHLI